MSLPQCFFLNVNSLASPSAQNENNDAKPFIPKEKVMSYEEKSVGSTSFFKCEACPYMALAEDDIKFHLFTEHPELAKTNGLADNIQIPCPGCTSIFDAEETLRTHLRSHHKMGIKDVKKMIKSLVQIALKNAKLKKEDKKEDPIPPPPIRETAEKQMPPLIEISPDVVNAEIDSLPKGVAFISVDEFQKISTPNFEKVNPKEIIQEASINIVYSNELSNPYVSNTPTSSTSCNIIQMSNVPPDLISSIQPRVAPVMSNNQLTMQQTNKTINVTHPMPQKPKPGRPKGTRLVGTYKENESIKEIDVEAKLGKLCSTDGCHVRLKSEEKLAYHRKCHQNGNLQCPECKQIFSGMDPLHSHLWKVHALDMELPTCEICGFKTYKKYRLYNIHMKCHGTEKSYPCLSCTKTFKNRNQLTKHMVTHKNQLKQVQCSICQREFSTQRRLMVHIAEVHEKLKPFKCGHCEYTAARKMQLKLHLRSHTGDKPYSCDQCSYRSGDHNSMRRHKKKHTKESLYKCKHCPYSTIQSTAFATHMISKHPDINSSDVFRCPYCPFKSVNIDNYMLHLSSHVDKEGIQLLMDMKKAAINSSKPSWTIPSKDGEMEQKNPNENNKVTSPKQPDNDIPIEVYDCDSLQERIPNKYSTIPENDAQKSNYIDQASSDFNKDENNSDCLISESSNDTVDRHQYQTQHQLQNIVYDNSPSSLHFLNTSVTMQQDIRQNNNVNSFVSSLSPLNTNMPGISNNIMSNFPIRLPTVPHISVRNNITLKPVDKISFPMTKVTGPIITPTQILPVPSSSNSSVSITNLEPESGPRKKPKISVKSNLILKGPDQVNMFHSQQKMAFKRLEDNERFGLGSPVTFNNLITTQFMQLPPEPSLSESPNNIMTYPQETLLDEAATPPVDSSLSDTSQIFNFNQQINVSTISMLPPQPKIQTTDSSYIKLEGTIKQNTQSPSLERMCNANTLLTNPALSREYKASPPLEVIKNEDKNDFYNIPLNTRASAPPIMDQYLIDNIIGEQFAGHLDLSTIVLPVMSEDQQNDVIEIDDNSDDNKLLPRFDMNFPLESLYLMHNDFHFLENEMSSNTLPGEVPVTDIIVDIPIKENMPVETSEVTNNDFPNFIQGKKDPMMNTSVRPSTNKINVKNIELMKN